MTINLPVKDTPGGVAGFSSPDYNTLASYAHTGQGQLQLRDSASAVPSSHLIQVMAMLEAIRDYGQAHAWAALVIEGEEIIPAGRFNWLHFVWLSQQKDQQRRVYAFIRELSQL